MKSNDDIQFNKESKNCMKLAPTYISKETPNGRNSNKGSYTSEWKMLRCTPWGSAKESQGFWSTTICWGESNGFVWAPLYVWLVIYLRPQNDVFIFFHQISVAKYLSGRNIGIKFQLGKGCPRNGGVWLAPLWQKWENIRWLPLLLPGGGEEPAMVVIKWMNS